MEGENIAPKTAAEAKKLIGKHVRYLRSQDIDKSGRGYFFPRFGIISEVHGRNIFMENGTDIQLSELVEMVEIQVTE
jgi:hypothetical protein